MKQLIWTLLIVGSSFLTYAGLSAVDHYSTKGQPQMRYVEDRHYLSTIEADSMVLNPDYDRQYYKQKNWKITYYYPLFGGRVDTDSVLLEEKLLSKSKD